MTTIKITPLKAGKELRFEICDRDTKEVTITTYNLESRKN